MLTNSSVCSYGALSLNKFNLTADSAEQQQKLHQYDRQRTGKQQLTVATAATTQ